MSKAVWSAARSSRRRMRVLLGEGNRRHRRVEGGTVGVEVPVAGAGDVGVVRVGEADRQAPGPRVAAAGEIVELRRWRVGDLVVVVELVGDLGGAGADDRAEVVVPPVDAARRGARSRGSSRSRPGRCRWSAAPRSRGAGRGRRSASCRRGRCVAGAAQVVGEGRQVGGELGGVVVDVGPARQHAGHEGGARRGRRAGSRCRRWRSGPSARRVGRGSGCAGRRPGRRGTGFRRAGRPSGSGCSGGSCGGLVTRWTSFSISAVASRVVSYCMQ